MTSFDPVQNIMQDAIGSALRAHWKLLMFQSIVMLILGFLAIAAPVIATIAVDIYIGWLFLISGIVGLVAMFSAKNIPAFLWSLLTAALSVIAGGLLIWNPVAGALSLTVVMTAFFIAEGVFQIVTSIAYHGVIGSSWGWMLVSGIADLVLAAIIILSWPVSAVWVLGLLVGINLITSGWAILMAALAGRKLAGGGSTA
ncbi:MAG TPA: HdeD family acid-resistance protein [Gallionella sp.]|nr:HdeD family acid-resistance protein [Gallionella sp.]